MNDRSQDLLPDLADILPGKLRPPFGVVMGATQTTVELIQALASPGITSYQMDLFQAARLEEELRERHLAAKVAAAPDLWDLPEPVQTMIYPVTPSGERILKIDMVEQAFHALAPGGVLVVLSPFENDQLFPALLKKIFGRMHAPRADGHQVFWAQRQGERPRRRHEITFQVRVREDLSLRFLSRPGVFSYGRFDHGARALMEIAQVNEGDQVLDLGCGCGTNGTLAAQAAGPTGHVVFADSNLRALALTELNARAAGVSSFDIVPSCTLREIPRERFDVVLANPPYFGQMAITQLFIGAARECLKAGGRLFLVTKQVEAVLPILEAAFTEVEAAEQRGYVVFAATK